MAQIDDLIAQMSTPDTQTRNWLLSTMNQATSSGMQALEQVAGQRGWGSRSGVLGGAAAQVQGAGLQQLQTGLVGAEQARLSNLIPLIIAKAEMDQREKERKSQLLNQLMGGIGGAVGTAGGAALGKI
jgi:hypothetical protein